MGKCDRDQPRPKRRLSANSEEDVSKRLRRGDKIQDNLADDEGLPETASQEATLLKQRLDHTKTTKQFADSNAQVVDATQAGMLEASSIVKDLLADAQHAPSPQDSATKTQPTISRDIIVLDDDASGLTRETGIEVDDDDEVDGTTRGQGPQHGHLASTTGAVRTTDRLIGTQNVQGSSSDLPSGGVAPIVAEPVSAEAPQQVAESQPEEYDESDLSDSSDDEYDSEDDDIVKLMAKNAPFETYKDSVTNNPVTIPRLFGVPRPMSSTSTETWISIGDEPLGLGHNRLRTGYIGTTRFFDSIDGSGSFSADLIEIAPPNYAALLSGKLQAEKRSSKPRTHRVPGSRRKGRRTVVFRLIRKKRSPGDLVLYENSSHSDQPVPRCWSEEPRVPPPSPPRFTADSSSLSHQDSDSEPTLQSGGNLEEHSDEDVSPDLEENSDPSHISLTDDEITHSAPEQVATVQPINKGSGLGVINDDVSTAEDSSTVPPPLVPERDIPHKPVSLATSSPQGSSSSIPVVPTESLHSSRPGPVRGNIWHMPQVTPATLPPTSGRLKELQLDASRAAAAALDQLNFKSTDQHNQANPRQRVSDRETPKSATTKKSGKSVASKTATKQATTKKATHPARKGPATKASKPRQAKKKITSPNKVSKPPVPSSSKEEVHRSRRSTSPMWYDDEYLLQKSRRNKILEDKRRMEDEIETARGIQGVNVFYMSDISEDEDTGAAPSGDSNDQHDRPDRAVTPPSPTISNFSVDIHAEGSNEDSQIGAAYEKLPYQNNTVTATAPELTMNENKPATQQLHNGAAYQGELNVNQVQEQRSENIPSEVPTLQLSRAMGSDSAHDIQPSQAEAGSRLPAVALPSSVNKPLGLAQQTSRMLPPNGFAI